MSEPSPAQTQIPLQLSSHSNISDGSSAPSSASVQSPLSPGSALPHLGPTSRSQSGLGPAQYSPYQLTGHTSRPAGYSQTYYPGTIGQTQHTSLPGYHEISHGPTTYGDSGAIPINSQISGQQGQKRAYRQRRKDPSCDACRERKVKVCYQLTIPS